MSDPAPAYDLPDDLRFEVRPIGVVRSPYRWHWDTPRQSVVADASGDRRDAFVVLRSGLQNTLQDLDGFSHVWIVAWFHHARGWNHQVRPPRDTRKRGLLATRAPHRPNPIGLSVVRLLGVRGTVLHVGGHDLLDGTPVLDVKPYVGYADAVPDARSGWVDALGDDAGPDHVDWEGRTFGRGG